MSSSKRPAKRTLVRWSDDIDKSVLLCINYACSEAGIKIPFGRVAEILGPKFSEGAIVQHLAKLRTKMMAEKGQIVPPPLKRGNVTKPTSSVYSPASKKRKDPEFINAIQNSVARSHAKSDDRKMKSESDDDGGEEGTQQLYDSDSEYGTSSNKKSKKSKKSRRVTIKQVPETGASAAAVKEEPGNPEDSGGAIADSPTMHTRGIKQDYSKMAGDASDEEDSGPEELEGEDGEEYSPEPPNKRVKPAGRKSTLFVRKAPASPAKAEKEEKQAAAAPVQATQQTRGALSYNNNNNNNNFISAPINSLGNFNMKNTTLQSPLGDDFYSNLDDFSLPTSHGFNNFGNFNGFNNFNFDGFDSFITPSAATQTGFVGMSNGFGAQDGGLWTPATTATPATTRNNSTASFINLPTPVQTTGANMQTGIEDVEPLFGLHDLDDLVNSDMEEFMTDV